MMPTASKDIVIRNKLGLHARPAMQFVDLANTFQCAVKVWKGDQCVDGKSIMQMMMLAATAGTGLKIVADGNDAANAFYRDSGFQHTRRFLQRKGRWMNEYVINGMEGGANCEKHL